MSRSPGAWRRSAPFCVNGSRLAWRLCNPPPRPSFTRARAARSPILHLLVLADATLAQLHRPLWQSRAHTSAPVMLWPLRAVHVRCCAWVCHSARFCIACTAYVCCCDAPSTSWQWLRASDCSLWSVVSCRYLETKDFTSAISVLNGLIIEVKRLDDKLLLVPLPLAHPRSHPRNACWSTRVAHSRGKTHPPNMPHPLRSTHAAAHPFLREFGMCLMLAR